MPHGQPGELAVPHGDVATSEGRREVDLATAVKVLRAWDRSANLDSVGTLLWRETMRACTVSPLRPGKNTSHSTRSGL